VKAKTCDVTKPLTSWLERETPPLPSSDSNRELVVSEGALPALIDILKSPPSAEVLSLLALLVQNYKY